MQMEAQDIIALVLVYVIIGGALGLSQYVQKKGINWDNRKIIHIGVGAFIYIWWAFTENWVMLIFFALPFAIILFFAMFPGNLISNSKLGEVTNDMGHRYGLFLYVVTINLVVIFCFDGHWLAGTIGIVAMTRGDGFGSIVGKKYGKHKIYHGKSLEGSLAVFAATAIITLFVIGVYGFLYTTDFGWAVNAQTVELSLALVCALVAGVLASVTEALAPGDFDNLLIPAVVIGAMVLLGL